jgi:lysine 2,3-aminomutase
MYKSQFSSSKVALLTEEDAEPPPTAPPREKKEQSVKKEDTEPPGLSLTMIKPVSLSIEGSEMLSLLHLHPRIRVLNRRQAGVVSPSLQSQLFCNTYYPGVTLAEWNDWKWQLKNRITELRALERVVCLSSEERQALRGAQGSLPVAITPYYASLIDAKNPEQSIRRTVIPVTTERILSAGESIDPLGEDDHSPVPGLVHRYPDRVLFLITGFCSVNCRYCTRSRIVGDSESYRFGKDQWEIALQYIESHPEVRDVLVSGGDPLTLSNERLEYLLNRLRRISHVEIIRIGTKVPVTLPQRITLTLTRMLKRFHPLWMSIHFTHPDELTSEVSEACGRLADTGIPLGSQTVLLKGINDDVETMKRLMQGLMKIRVKPYYIYQCDPIVGSSHFRTTVSRGLEIIQGLRGYTSGYAVPHYVIDAPGGGGKIPICPEYVVGRDGSFLVLRNYEVKLFKYPDTASPEDSIGAKKSGRGAV